MIDPAEDQVPLLELPDDLLRRIAARASVEWLPDDGIWVTTLEGYPGAWSYGATPEEAKGELVDVLRGWISVGAYHGHRLPAET